jgi:hypothetical protein
VGFYTETKDDRNATVIRFSPLSSPLLHSAESVDADRAESFLIEALSDHAEEVFNLSRSGYDLEAMKQDAIVHYWFLEVGLSSEFS